MNASVITFIKDESLFNIFHTFTKITFISFLVSVYSLGHERRKTIYTIDFHRKLIWTSLNANVLFVLTWGNLRNDSSLGFPRTCHQLILSICF